MTIQQAANTAGARLRRAAQIVARALSARAPSEADAFASRDDDTVFQTRAANARAAPRARTLRGKGG
jgi:hypothetical protein